MDTIPQDDTPRKRCTGICGRTLPATAEYFHAAKKGKYGLFAKCKECRLAYRRQPEILEHKQAYDKDYLRQPEVQAHKRDYGKARRTNPEIRELLLAQKRASYYKTHKTSPRIRQSVDKRTRMKLYRSRPDIQEHTRIYNREYHQRPERKARLRIWTPTYRSRPLVREREQAACRSHRARKKAVPGDLTAQQIQDKLKAQHYKCYYAACGHAKFEKRNGKYVYHIEHTIPLSRLEAGPRHDVNYVVLSCPHCNLSKKDKLPHEFPEGGRLL